jgi:hypothetical protein
MKHTATAVILALLAASFAAPITAGAAQEAKVCGHVDASPTYIFELSQVRPIAGNFILALSGSEIVQTTVNFDGSFCFDNLRPELYRLEAFSDGDSPYQTNVMPIEGQTVNVYIR